MSEVVTQEYFFDLFESFDPDILLSLNSSYPKSGSRRNFFLSLSEPLNAVERVPAYLRFAWLLFRGPALRRRREKENSIRTVFPHEFWERERRILSHYIESFGAEE